METILRILGTDGSWSGLVLRLALGSVIWMHGAQKLLGIFGGYGFSGTMDFFTKTMGLPWIIALLVILGEFFGGIGLILGIGTRFFALYTGIISFVCDVSCSLGKRFLYELVWKPEG